MKATILTLFPELLEEFKKHSIIAKAIKEQKLNIEVVNFRDFSDDKRKKVDDYAFGHGDGMLLKAQPIVDCIKHYKTKDTKVILMSPQGEKFSNSIAKQYIKQDVIIVCGHYEGFDERVRDYIDLEISIGDYVLTGGEIPAMIFVDAVTRFIPGVLKEGSVENDSFENGLLDYPSYTKPIEFDGKKVPDVLLSGNHKLIDEWRKEKSLEKTKLKRPDLYKKVIK